MIRIRATGIGTFWVIVAFLALVSNSLAQPLNVDAAKKEGKVVIYGTVVPQVMSQIEKGFESKYGIKTEYWRADATKVIDRVLTEWRAGKPGFDVVIGARGPLALGKQERLCQVLSRQHGEFSRQVQRQGRATHCVADYAGGCSL